MQLLLVESFCYPSQNPKQGCLYSTGQIPLWKVWIQLFLLQLQVNIKIAGLFTRFFFPKIGYMRSVPITKPDYGMSLLKSSIAYMILIHQSPFSGAYISFISFSFPFTEMVNLQDGHLAPTSIIQTNKHSPIITETDCPTN